MWCIEAKAKIDIPLGLKENDYMNWGNAMLVQFLISNQVNCMEFMDALNWLGTTMNCKQAIEKCNNKYWKEWFFKIMRNKKYGGIVKKGETITITKGVDDKNYTLWHHTGLWQLHEDYVGETIRVISPN